LQGHIKLIESDGKDIYNVIKCIHFNDEMQLFINAVLLIFLYLLANPEKICIMDYTKILSNTTVFSIDKNVKENRKRLLTMLLFLLYFLIK